MSENRNWLDQLAARLVPGSGDSGPEGSGPKGSAPEVSGPEGSGPAPDIAERDAEPPLSVADYLSAAFAIIEEQAERDPVFAANLAQALGATIVLEGAMAARALDPLAYTRRHGTAGLKRALSRMNRDELRAFVRAHQLVSQAEFRQAQTPAALIDQAARTVVYRLRERDPDEAAPIG